MSLRHQNAANAYRLLGDGISDRWHYDTLRRYMSEDVIVLLRKAGVLLAPPNENFQRGWHDLDVVALEKWYIVETLITSVVP